MEVAIRNTNGYIPLSALPVGAGGGNKGLDFNARERANMG
jgi:hypothetical protein